MPVDELEFFGASALTFSSIVAGSIASASIIVSALVAFALSNNPLTHINSAYTAFTARVLSIKPLEEVIPSLVYKVKEYAVTARERIRAIRRFLLLHLR